MREVELWGYRINEDGHIYDKNGVELNNIMFTTPVGHISKGRLIYYAFNQDTFNLLNMSYRIQRIRKGDNDFRLSNLHKVKSRAKEVKSRVLTDKEIDLIRKEYQESIALSKVLGQNYPWRRVSCRSLAKKYGVSHTQINNIVNYKDKVYIKGEE